MLFAFRKTAPSPSASPSPFLFDDAAMQKVAEQHQTAYQHAEPFAHTVIDDFLPTSVADEIITRFPAPNAPFWFDWKAGDTQHQPKKLGLGHIRNFEGADPYLHQILFAFNSYPFIHFLETLTGIDGLIPDPHFHGGGLHQILPGGRLDIHADFNYLPKLKLYRQINVLLYLNKNWRDEYGGAIELWNRDMSACAQKIMPLFNRCVIFNTGSHSYHGHPHPLTCPEGVTRKSLAFYYYTREELGNQTDAHSTLWQQPHNAG